MVPRDDEHEARDGEKDLEDGDGRDDAFPEVVEVAIGDELDLHAFAPRDVGTLVADWLDECVVRGFSEVRIVHGKGTGTLRRVVHGVLARHPAVASFALAPSERGGWGATIAILRQGAKRG